MKQRPVSLEKIVKVLYWPGQWDPRALIKLIIPDVRTWWSGYSRKPSLHISQLSCPAKLWEPVYLHHSISALYLLPLSTFAKFGMPEWPTRRNPPGIPWQLDLEYKILLVISFCKESHYITQGWFPCWGDAHYQGMLLVMLCAPRLSWVYVFFSICLEKLLGVDLENL